MIDDCFGPEKQKAFMGGLKNINVYANEQTRQNIENMAPRQVENLIRSILDHPSTANKEANDQEVIEFEQIQYCVHTTKSLTIQGFMASEYIMTEVMPYKLVPGPFQGKVRVQENEKVNING